MPALYVVATPIGNLEDVSLRALRILREVKLIAAEDTRVTRRLLAAYDIKTPLTSYHERNKLTKLDYIISCLEQGDVALVSNAGMPVISDPGFELVAAVARRGIQVVPVPGASAITTALATSGFPVGQFVYLGFLPRKRGERRRRLAAVADFPGAIIILEAPHRLVATLKDVLSALGDRQIAVCRELTKIYEEIFRGTVSQSLERFTEPKGEFTLIVEGRMAPAKPQLDGDASARLGYLRQSGATAREAISVVAAETGLSRKQLYQAWLELS